MGQSKERGFGCRIQDSLKDRSETLPLPTMPPPSQGSRHQISLGSWGASQPGLPDLNLSPLWSGNLSLSGIWAADPIKWRRCDLLSGLSQLVPHDHPAWQPWLGFSLPLAGWLQQVRSSACICLLVYKPKTGLLWESKKTMDISICWLSSVKKVIVIVVITRTQGDMLKWVSKWFG